MNDSASQQSYDPVTALARSLFGFALVAWLPLLATALLLLLAPGTAESYAPLKSALDHAFAIAAASGLAALIWLYRLDSSSSTGIARRIAAIFHSRWFCLLLTLALIEANILAQILAHDIAPSVTDPAKFLLLCWSLLFGGLIATVHWQPLRRAYSDSRDHFAFAGILIAALLLVAVLSLISHRLIVASGIHDRLRGRLDYRPLQFVEDGSAPSARNFWAEQAQTRVRWLPYSYWVVAPLAGELINVDSRGLRRTATITDDPTAPRIFFFGGSTLWGEGARDDFTIPSQVARRLVEVNRPASVENYAQTGYVSTQDLILFQRQLAQGNLPDLAVFYQGFNDVFSAFQQNRAGLPMQENLRLADAEAGRLLRQGQPVLRPLAVDLGQADWSLVSAGAASADGVVDAWLANRRLIRASAEEFDVRILFVWQPAIYSKARLSDYEAQVAVQLESEMPGFQALYREIDHLMRARLAEEPMDDIVFLTDLFSDSDQDIFFDRVHINEIGNRHIAEAILPAIVERLYVD